jgi:transcriptional regulator with XRE-family HTH domain
MCELAPMSIKVNVGLRIRELRNQIGISQEALANKAEIDRTYVTDVENGRRNISIENLQKLVNALEIQFKDFFDAPNFNK